MQTQLGISQQSMFSGLVNSHAMKIKEVHLEKFKRFTDLTIKGIPNTAKLIVLVGPNGCGKSSLFDAFKAWHLYRAYNNIANEDYCKKDQNETRPNYELVNIAFHNQSYITNKNSYRSAFYFRTAYRNSPKISIDSLSKITSPLERPNHNMMIQNDDTVNDNYQRIISKTITNLYNTQNDEKTVKALRDELLKKIRDPLNRLFPDLVLTEIGLVTDKAEFYFSKGCIEKYGYEKLSGGEKAAFDLLLDLVIKSEYYKNTIFCIDEPETHVHTALQARLLHEIFDLVPKQSQLWIATHSLGMLKEAKKLKQQYPDEVVFLDFDGHDFDDIVTIEPSECDSILWKKMLEITLGDYSTYIVPETIVFCEGSSSGKTRKDFDARCYTNIFSSSHPSTLFYSSGSCSDIKEQQTIVNFIRLLSPNSNIIRLIDRDDQSPEETLDLNNEGLTVLNRRHLECYILDDEVLRKWCTINQKTEKIPEMLQIKEEAMEKSVQRGNPIDDLKSAANEICTNGKKLLGLTKCGNTGDIIMRDTLARLITSDMAIYQELEKDVFGNIT